MNELTRAGRFRLLIGLGALGLAFTLEMAALVAPISCSRPAPDDDGNSPYVVLVVPALWLVALVLLVWGRQRTVWGGRRLGSLAVVALFFFVAAGRLVGTCMD